MKKILLALFMCLMLTGCTAQYNITVYSDKIEEDATIYFSDVDVVKNNLEELTNKKNDVYLGKKKYYKVTYDDMKSFNYKYTHDIKEYPNAKVINWCYEDRNIRTENGIFIIETKGKFNCIDFESNTPLTDAQINIKTNQRVLSNNADVVKGNTYTWNINKDNYLNKPINMEIKLRDKSFNNGQIEMTIIFSIIVLVGALIYLFVKRKKEKNNSI